MERIERIIEACRWVAAKGVGGRDGCRVSTRVKWADWDKKEFSPAMCVLWKSTVDSGADGYDTFRIPPSEVWLSRVASALDVSEEWVVKFVDQCYNGGVNPDKWTFSVTFDGVNGVYLKNPRFLWKRESVGDDILPEVEAIINEYGAHLPAPQPPYWTKNPPVDLYKSKLIGAAYDLFCSMEARGDYNKESASAASNSSSSPSK